MSLTERPTSPWFKDVKFSARQLFTSLGKGLANFATGNWTQVGVNAVDMVAAVGIHASPEERAWILIQRSMVKAIHDLTRDVRRLLDVKAKPDFERIGKDLEARLDAIPVAVTAQFIEQPKKEPFVAEMCTVYCEWLRAVGISIEKAQSESARLPGYFVYALREESRRFSDHYKPIFEQLTGPFSKATEREWRWNVYRAWLQRQVDQPVFDEPFSLRQIFIPLRGFYKLHVDEQSRIESQLLQKAPNSARAVWLEQDMDEWRQRNDTGYTLRILSGDPGSGKSSFAKMYADHLAEAGEYVMYVPLQSFKWMDDVSDALTDFCKRDEFLPEDVCDAKVGEPNMFIIFDGLDELAKQGRAAEEAAQQFVREVRNLLTVRNRSEVRLRVLICGRPISIQAVDGELRKEGQILHVARYHYTNDEEDEFLDFDILRPDQRQLWWQAFGTLTGNNYRGLPSPLAKPQLDVITAQPLLNYLVALSFRRGKITFSHGVNMNLVYADLLEAVYTRAYEPREDSRHTSAQLMKLVEFENVMQQVGLAAWHGNTRTTTASAIEKRCKAAGLEVLLEKFRDGAKSGVSRLLLAFYFQENELKASAEKTFEFTHKSFGEYLTAVAIVNTLADIQEELNRRAATPGKGWDVRESLKHWITVCGPGTLDKNLYGFLVSEIKVRASNDLNQVKTWQQTLFVLIAEAMQRAMPMELLGPERPDSFYIDISRSRNAEIALLTVHSACAETTGKCSGSDVLTTSQEVNTLVSLQLGSWLRRLQGSADTLQPLVRQCLNNIDLHHADLKQLYLEGCDFAHLRACNIQLQMCYLSAMQGQNADFSDSQLYAAVLSYANCSGAIFKSATIRHAQFYRAKLNKADFSLCDGNCADFFSSDLSKAVMLGARLPDANFQYAILNGVDFRFADLRGADFRNADLRDVDFRCADITDALIAEEQLAVVKFLPNDPLPISKKLRRKYTLVKSQRRVDHSQHAID